MTNKLTISEKIRKHYNSEDGEWIIQAGKMKEAKLLKEACETIEKQENEIIKLRQSASSVWHANKQAKAEVILPYQKQINELKTDLKLEKERISELKHAFKSVNNIFEAEYFTSGYW